MRYFVKLPGSLVIDRTTLRLVKLGYQRVGRNSINRGSALCAGDKTNQQLGNYGYVFSGMAHRTANSPPLRITGESKVTSLAGRREHAGNNNTMRRSAPGSKLPSPSVTWTTGLSFPRFKVLLPIACHIQTCKLTPTSWGEVLEVPPVPGLVLRTSKVRSIIC